MFSLGQTVKPLPPFAVSFTSTYIIIDIVNNSDDTVVYILDQDAGASMQFIWS